jgi:hypothetical protein
LVIRNEIHRRECREKRQEDRGGVKRKKERSKIHRSPPARQFVRRGQKAPLPVRQAGRKEARFTAPAKQHVGQEGAENRGKNYDVPGRIYYRPA